MNGLSLAPVGRSSVGNMFVKMLMHLERSNPYEMGFSGSSGLVSGLWFL